MSEERWFSIARGSVSRMACDETCLEAILTHGLANAINGATRRSIIGPSPREKATPKAPSA